MNNEKKQKKNKKNNKIKLTVKIVIILTLLVLMLAIMLMTLFSTTIAHNLAFMRYKFYVMESASQPYIAEKGDLVIVKRAKPGEVVKGDGIVFGGREFYYCDSVVETKRVNTVYKMVIAENEGIRYQFDESEIEGKVVYNIPNLGNIVLFLRTPLGRVFFIIFIICVFLLLRILLVKDDDEEDEEDDDQDNYNDEEELKEKNNNKKINTNTKAIQKNGQK